MGAGVTVLFSIGEALKKKDERAGGGSDSSEAALIGGRWPEALSTARAILLNPVITMTLAGFAYKLAFGWTLTLRDSKMRLEFPHPLSDLLELLTAPFGMCALFLTGTSLRGLRVSLVSCLLVAMKVVVCAYVSYALAGSLVDGRELRGFSFLYGMIPTSSAPLLFAMRYSPASAPLLASSILLGLVAAGPLMFAAALFLEHDEETMVDTLSRVQLTTTLAAFACATLCLASLGGLALRDAWGGAGPQRALLLCYAATLVVYAAAMAAMSPLLDDGPCSRYNASRGWSAMALFLGWLQNSSRFLLLSLQLLHTTAAPWRDRGAALLALSLLLGAVPSVLVYPNTLNEVCSAVKPRLDPATLHLAPNLAWNVLLLLTSCGLFAYGSTRPHAPRRSTAALPPTAHSSDHSSDHASDPAADVEARGRGCGGVAPGAAGGASRASLTASMRASSALPDGLVHGLAAFATLRFFLQCVNTLLVEFDSAVAGAFAEMLVIENVLEHSQAVVLLVLLVSDSSFSGAVAKLRPAAGGEGQGGRRQGLGTFNIFAVTGDADSARRPVSLESDSSGEPIAAADGSTSHHSATSHLPASGRRPSRFASPGGMPTLN